MTRGIGLVVFTDGRGEYLVRTMQSMTQHIAYQFDYALMIDDSGNSDYASWLDRTFPSFHHIHHAERIGFAGAVRSAWQRLPACRYVFTLEEDYTFNKDIDINVMSYVLDAEPKLAQLVLLRQPWNSHEIEAGGIIPLHPDWYTERETVGVWITEHDAFFSTNPNLMRYELTQNRGNIPWPNESESEGKYGAWVRSKGYSFAFLGKKSDAPLVEHIGVRRIGIGY